MTLFIPRHDDRRWFSEEHHPLRAAIALLLIIGLLGVQSLFFTTRLSAASYSTTWSTQEDFESNAITGEGATTRTNVNTATAAGSVYLGVASTSNHSFTETFTDTTNIDTGATTGTVSGGQLSVAAASSVDLFAELLEGYGANETLSLADPAGGKIIANEYAYDVSGQTVTNVRSSLPIYPYNHSGPRITDPTSGKVFLTSTDANYFGWYKPSDGTKSAIITTMAGVGSRVYAMVVDSTNGMVYAGDLNGGFRSYNIATGAVTDLSAAVSGLITSVRSMALDTTNGIVYLGGTSGAFVGYSISGGTATNRTSALAMVSTVDVLEFNPSDGKIYAWSRGSPVKFRAYNPATQTSADLASYISSTWGTTQYLNAMRILNGVVYLVGNSATFVSYTTSNQTSANLTSSVSSTFTNQGVTVAISSVTVDAANTMLYLGGSSGKFASYNPGTQAVVNLSSNFYSVWTTASAGVINLETSPDGSTIHILKRSPDSWATYDIGSGVTTFRASNSVYSSETKLSMNADGTRLYTANGTNFGYFDTATYQYVSISGLAPFGSGGVGAFVNPVSGIVYLPGSDKLISYNPSNGQFSDITGNLFTSLGGTSRRVMSMAFNTAGTVAYLGSNTGNFAKYDIGSATYTNLTSLFSLSSNAVRDVVYNPINDLVYLSGAQAGGVYSYNPANNAVALITSSMPASVYDLEVDSSSGRVYAAGATNAFSYITPSTGSATSLNSAISSWFSASESTVAAVTLNSSTGKLYIAGYDEFGSVDPGGSSVAQSTVVDSFGPSNIAYATLTKNDTPGTGTVTYQLSNDGGSTWETVTAGALHTFTSAGSSLKWKVTITGNATVQDLTISYNGYATTGTISNLKKDAGGDAVWQTITWNAAVPSGTAIKFRTRGATAAQGVAALSAASWSPYYVGSGESITNAAGQALQVWRYIEVELTLESTQAGGSHGAATPTLADVTVNYSINAAPEFNADYPSTAAGGASASQITSSADPDWGKVSIAYSVRDTDTSTGSFTPGYVTPSFEYRLSEGAGWTAIEEAYLSAGAVTNKSVSASDYTTYTALWNAAGQISGNYSATAQVRVSVNDNEQVFNITRAAAAAMTLDTTAPSVTFTTNQSAGTVSLTATDNTTILDYSISNSADLSSPTTGSGTSTTLGVTPSWTFPSPGTSVDVYARVRDSYGNVTSVTSYGPVTPNAINIRDISVVSPAEYREFIAWTVYSASAPAQAAFEKYEVYRSTDGISYSLLASVTNRTTNYYIDAAVSANQTYYYKVRVVDTDGDISDFTAVTSDTADGQGGTDQTAPTLSVVASSDVKNASAKITWTTDELSNSRVEYGTTLSYGSVATDPSYVTSHTVYLSGLTPNTAYYFRVKSTDISTNIGVNDNSAAGYTFTTAGGPVMSDIVASPSSNSADITWNTSVLSTSYVYYDTSASFTNSNPKVGSATLATGHRVTIPDLLPATTYYYKVESTDGDSNQTLIDKDSSGSALQFNTTNDTTAPVISSISAPVRASNSAVITWQTDELADSQVQYGTVAGEYSKTTVRNDTDTIFHVVTLSAETSPSVGSGTNALTKSTTYYFRVVSRDEAGNSSTSDEYSFTTTEDGAVTVNVAAGAAVASDQTAPILSSVKVSAVNAFGATVSFITNEPTYAFIHYGPSTTYDSTGGSATLSTSHSVPLKGLRSGTTYHFAARGIDKFGNETVSGDATFKTEYLSENLGNLSILENAEDLQEKIENLIESALPSLNPPFIETPAVSEIAEDRAAVTWKTNVKSYGAVSYATDEEYAKEKKYTADASGPAEKLTSHRVELTGLIPNTKYNFSVKSYVFPQVPGTSDNITFLTRAAKVRAQIIDVKKDSFRAVWRTDEPTTSVVEYKKRGSAAAYKKTDDTMASQHSILVEGLTPATMYDLSIYGYNAKGNLIETRGDLSVSTSRDITAPVISNLKIDAALVPGRTDRIQAVVTWKTDEPSTSIVRYQEGTGAPDDALSGKAEDLSTYTDNHVVIVPSLKPGAIYRIQVVSTDDSNNEAALPVRTIITPRQGESIVDVIFKNFEDTFKFMQNVR